MLPTGWSGERGWAVRPASGAPISATRSASSGRAARCGVPIARRFLAANPMRWSPSCSSEPYVPAGEIERARPHGTAVTGRRARPATGRCPHLGQLIRDRTRLIVMTEEGGGARVVPGRILLRSGHAAGRHPAEPVSLPALPGQRRQSHVPGQPLDPPFPPSVRRNERIGGGFLRRRLSRERCRGLLPELVAVDFHERSRVVEVADALNARGR